ncbi:hypothetical protein YC2023_030617 [Brassica napus]
MDRNREARRVPMAAAGNGLSRRRHRAGSFRDSPEEEGPVELPEAARLRDRTRKERDRERDREREHRERDRLHSRSKRRRGERLIMVHDGGDESSEESVNDDEEYENIFSSPLSNHQRKNFPTPPSKNFRSPPTPALPVPSWKAAADEMIGVAVPRKARSACTKRPHESWTSNASPAAPTSPSSSNVKKITLGAKQKQPLPQKVSSSPVAVQDEIEIEIAEVLYGMMRMPTSKQEEKTTVDIKARVSSPISITLAANSSSIAPKRKKQRHVKYEEDENSSGLPSRATKLEAEAPLGDELKRSGSGEENSSVLDSINPELRESNAALDSRSAEKKEETVLPKVESSSGVRSGGDVAKPSSPEKEKFEIDLMAPPPGRSSSERVGEMECVAAEAEPKVTEVETEPKPLLKEDGGSAAIVESEEKKRPRTVDEAEPHTSERSCELKLDLDKSDHVAQANSLPLHMSMPGWPGGLPTMGYMPSTQGVVPTDTSSLSSVAMQHGPTFIFPVGQQPTITAASVRPPNSGNTASSGATASANSMNGSASATPAGAPTMTFSCPGMPGNETQYLAIMQNNGYPFPVPAHVGAPHAYRGAPGQPIPFFNGSFYSSQMIQSPFSQPQKQQHQPQQQQAGQMLQSHAPNNQNGNVSSGSSAAQKHLQNHQLRPHGNSEGYPTHKVQSQVLTFQQRQQPRENATQHSDTVGENSPSAADSRGSRSNVAYGQNYGMQMQPTNLGLMSSAAPGGGVVVSSSNHGEKKSQQQVSKAGAESFQSQGYAMTFANGVSSTAQNHATFQSLPEAARQGYQMMAANVAAQQKMNYSAPSEGKSGSNATAKTLEEQRKTEGASGKTSGVNGGQSIAFSSKHDLGDASVSAVTSGNIVDTSRLLNLGPVVSNGTGVADHSISVSPVGTAKFPNANSGFPQNLVQSSSSQVQSPQWKSNSPRTTNTSQAQSPSILSPSSSVAASSSPRNVSHKQQSRPQQSQISFAANSKPTATGSPMQQVQGGTNNQAPSSPMLVGSPSTSSVSKNTGGSPRTTASASSAVNKAGQASFTTHSSSQPSKNLQPASVASSAAVGRNNGPSVLGNPTTSSGSKSQQQQLPKHGLQQQAQLFFSNPYMQSQHQQQQITMSSSGGYYIQRHQQQPGSAAACPPVSTTGSVMATSDPAKAMAAAAAGNNLKGGGKTQQHQLGPPGFGLPYVHAVPCAVQVKPVDQKQQSGE